MQKTREIYFEELAHNRAFTFFCGAGTELRSVRKSDTSGFGIELT